RERDAASSVSTESSRLVARMDVLGFRYDRAGPPLLPHAVEVMQRPHSLAQRMSIRNRSRDISLGEQNRLGDSAPMRQMAGQRRRERASGAMRGIRALAVRLEHFLFDPADGREAEEVDRLLQVASGNDHI